MCITFHIAWKQSISWSWRAHVHLTQTILHAASLCSMPALVSSFRVPYRDTSGVLPLAVTHRLHTTRRGSNRCSSDILIAETVPELLNSALKVVFSCQQTIFHPVSLPLSNPNYFLAFLVYLTILFILLRNHLVLFVVLSSSTSQSPPSYIYYHLHCS
jgi:hypothetical protein